MTDLLTLRCKRPTGLHSAITIPLGAQQQNKTYYLTVGEAEEPLLQSAPNANTDPQVRLGEKIVFYMSIDVAADSRLSGAGTECYSAIPA